MSKYDPLTKYLTSRGDREVRMSFSEIEAVLGFPLPGKSKSVRAWWSNNPSNNVMTKAWLAAGYKTAQVDVAGERLSFVPNLESGGFKEMQQSSYDPKEPTTPTQAMSKGKSLKRHPLFGIWKGKVTLDPDYDYTQPADPDWGKVYED